MGYCLLIFSIFWFVSSFIFWFALTRIQYRAVRNYRSDLDSIQQELEVCQDLLGKRPLSDFERNALTVAVYHLDCLLDRHNDIFDVHPLV